MSEGRSGGALQGAHILIVDDERAMRISLSEILGLRGSLVTAASDGQEAVDMLAEFDFDLMLLDLKMPGMDGLQVLEVAQKIRPATVVIMLTAHATLDSAIGALRRGAFDYLLKPCDPRAMVTSLERGLKKRQEFQRRQGLMNIIEQTVSSLASADTPATAWLLNSLPLVQDSGNVVRAGTIIIDLPRRAATINGVSLALSPTEFDLLIYLARNLDRVVACRELVKETLGYDVKENEARPIIRMHVHRLRRKLEQAGATSTRLATVRGAGYMLVTEE
jgi:DNA-binding response OmpR family regulator